MEFITNIIIEYLKRNKRLCVPKLGTFIVKQSSGTIIFSDLMRSDDGVLRSLLMDAGKREREATGLIDRFVFEVRHAITTEGRMKIEGFGEFTADRNNTISFTAAPLKRVFGGNVKPPVEVIKKRIPQKRVQTPHRPPYSATATPVKRTAKRHVESQEEGITLGKPDPYLRGLKYDSRKNKKREESTHATRVHGGGKSWIVILLLIVAAAAAAYMLWPRTTSRPTPPTNGAEAVVERDTTLIDSIPVIDSLNTPNTEGAQLPATTITTTP